MRKIVKFIVFSLVITLFSVSNVNEVSALTMNGIRRNIQFGEQNLYLDFGNQQDAIARPKSGGSTQDLYFVYYPHKKAYKIHSASNPNLILAWNDYFYSNNVFFTNNGNLDEHYWVLEKEGNQFNHKYYLRNYKKNDGYGYLGARNNQGYMNVSIDSKDRGYTELNISPEVPVEYPSIVTNGKPAKIESVEYNRYLLNFAVVPGSSVVMNPSRPGLDSSFYIDYNESKNAYQIRHSSYNTVLSIDNNNKVLSVSRNYNDNKQFWQLEYNTDGSFIISNYENPNKVLDIDVNQYNKHSVVVKEKEYSRTQKFYIYE